MFAVLADLKVPTNMANVVVSMRIMPTNPSVDLHKLETEAKKEIVKFCSSQEFKTEIQPVAFGIKAVMIIFVMDEKIGSTEALEGKVAQLRGVESVEVTDVRRAVG